ncbi:hypothetical protein Ccrd_001857 [Cynara cardunculus var. scolymus]|uniref:Uncharacterized protein n=1 Tax=Cynara cardunculus var. scolymus TaxID=59895 RepID=A0A103XSH0_CYNCS|nr:hypothetical protein Ccrd_001857 [Cynara cardunculus var. scolymus]
MTSMFQKQKSLPVSHNTTHDPSPATDGMRRRMSFQIHPPTISDTTAWALRSTKSVSSMGESASTSIRNWWDRGWGWILSRKPVFAQDLEMNQEETSVLGCHNKGSWRHILYKVRSEIRKLVRSDQAGLPQTIRTKAYSSAI